MKKSKMKQERGVTLIALVITIIVLLVLAAAAIATLTGDNGIFSNAQNARAENKKAEVREKYLLAYNTVRTQILTESTTNGEYHSNSEESSKKLAELVLQDLTGQKQTITDSFTNQEYKADSGTYTLNFTKGNGTTNSIIEITYRDSIFKENGKITSLNQDTYPIKCKITIDDNICHLKIENDGYGNESDYGDTAYIYSVADDLGVQAKINPLEMKPVKYDTTSGTWVEADPTVKGDWFDYSSKKWANVETENGYFVYIPRFAYKITAGYHTSRSDAGTIAIVFLNGDNTLKTTKDSEGNTVSQSDLVTADQVNSSTINSGINASTKYIIHPAFTAFGNVDGIWVAKYEMSMEKSTDSGTTWNPVTVIDSSTVGDVPTNPTTLRMTSKAGQKSWTYIRVTNIFDNCYNMNRALDSHMMKNTEWGAVAYLTVSKYGKGATSEVEQNKKSGYYTGYGADSTLSTGAASTTGDMYGIFDMSGGAWEYVAGYLNDPECMVEGQDRYNYSKSLILAETKYKDVYEIGSSNAYSNCYTANNLKVGDALWEVTSNTGSTYAWYGDGSYFVGLHDSVHSPVFVRGGLYDDSGASAGVFCASRRNGNSDSLNGFRCVCVV